MHINSLSTLPLWGCIVANFLLVSCSPQVTSPEKEPNADKSFQRIITLSPSLTETVFALGLGDRVVGVSSYCNYPPEARGKTHVGALLDTNYEAVVSLKPDLVLLLPFHREQAESLRKIGMNVRVVNQEEVYAFLDSIKIIGELCGVPEKAAAMEKDLREKVQKIQDAVKDLPKPKVLVSIGRDYGSGKMEQVFIANSGDFHGQMVTLAGGINVFESGSIKYPSLSAEGLLRLNPEVILEMVPDLKEKNYDPEKILQDWKTLPDLQAVKNNRIHILSEDYVSIPGPRFILLLEQVARILHPEIQLEAS